MLAVGYSDQSKAFIVRNSWGEQWVNKDSHFLDDIFQSILGGERLLLYSV